MNKIIEYDSPVANIYLDERNIFIFKLKESGAIYDVEEGVNQYEFLNYHSKGKPYKIVVDTRGSLIIPTSKACEFYLDIDNSKNFVALIVNSLPMQLLLGQMSKNKNIPISKIFKNKVAAFEWIIEK
jgi:hypothetical protein